MAVSQETLRLIVDAQLKGQKDLTNVIKGLDNLDKAAKRTNQSLSIISLDVLFSRGRQLAEASLEIGLLGTRIDSLRESFQTTSTSVGQDADAMLEALEKSARGQINSIDLITSANRAMLLGVATSAEEMAKLMEIAEVRGSAMGLTLNQAFNDIVTGIGRGSALILDNLGIVVDLEKAYRRFAEQNGRTVSSLTDLEQKQLIVNEVIKQSESLVAGADFSKLTSEFEKAQAQAENFGINLANAFTEIIGRDLAGRLADQLERVNAALNSVEGQENIAVAAQVVDDQISKIDQLLEQYEQNTQRQAEAIDSAYETLFNIPGVQAARTAIQGLQSDLAELGVRPIDLGDLDSALDALRELENAVVPQGLNDFLKAFNPGPIVSFEDAFTSFENSVNEAQVAEEFDRMVNALAGAQPSFPDETAAAMKRLKDETLQANLEFEELLKLIGNIEASGAKAIGAAAAGIVDIVGQETALRLAEDTTAEYRKQIQAIDFANVSLTERAFLENTIRNEALEGFQAIQEGYKESQSASRRAARDGEQAFNQLQGKVSSVLAEALDVGVGIDFDEILGREDAINEPARRLADIAVNGFNSPWVDYFKKEFPELAKSLFAEGFDVKQQAARILQGFEQGLRPELIDKNLAKERIRALLVGEANLSQLAQEITQELASEFRGTPLGTITGLTNRVLGIDTNQVQAQAQQLTTSFQQGVDASLGQNNLSNTQLSQVLLGNADVATLATETIQNFITALNATPVDQVTSLADTFIDNFSTALDSAPIDQVDVISKFFTVDDTSVTSLAEDILSTFQTALNSQGGGASSNQDLIQGIFFSDTDFTSLANSAITNFTDAFDSITIPSTNIASNLFSIDSSTLQSQAEQLLLSFQSSLSADQIDPSLAQERLNALFIGDTDFNEFATSILQQFSTAFNSISPDQSDSLLRSMLDVSGSPEVAIQATALSEGFTSAFANTNIGTAISTVIETQMNDEKNLTVLRQSGANSGSNWGDGFLNTVGENVPPRLIGILVDLVTPGVQAGLTRQESLVNPQ